MPRAQLLCRYQLLVPIRAGGVAGVDRGLATELACAAGRAPMVEAERPASVLLPSTAAALVDRGGDRFAGGGWDVAFASRVVASGRERALLSNDQPPLAWG